MDSENYILEAIYCEDNGEFRVHFITCDKLFIEQFYKSPLKSKTPNNNTRKKNN